MSNKEQIFSEVESIDELANILSSFTEDDLVKYDRESRIQIRDELQKLCHEFKVAVPKYFKDVEKSQDLYDAQAALRGIVPQSPLDYINNDYDTNFVSLDGFRRWLSAQDALEHDVENAKASIEPEDQEMKDFLKNEVA